MRAGLHVDRAVGPMGEGRMRMNRIRATPRRGSFPASLEAGDSSRNVGLLRGALRGVK
jgi:hypothetical protein